MKKFLSVSAIALCSFVTLGTQAASVAIFDDPAYVDTNNGYWSESDTLQATTTALGHSVSTFTGTDFASWNTALAGVSVAMIPESENSSSTGLNLETNGAGQALRDFVSAGGTFMSFFDSGNGNDSVFSNVFGITLGSSGQGLDITADGIAAGYSAVSLSGLSATLGWNSTDVAAAGGTSYYSTGNSSSLVSFNYGAGTIYGFGWDWFNAQPLGTEGQGWLSVLGHTLDNVTEQPPRIPEPASLALLGLGLLGLGATRKRK